jgi:hypothetical protein
VELHRIDLRPELRPQTGRDRNDLRLPRGYGPTPMSYLGGVIGQSDQPIYAAARWLLDHGIATADDVATYRNGVLSMSGNIGELAEWTIEELKKGKPTTPSYPVEALFLRRYRAKDGRRAGIRVTATSLAKGLQNCISHVAGTIIERKQP